MSKCAAEGCEGKVYGKGYCRPHWWRMHRYGRLHKIVARGVHLVCTIDGCGDTKIKGHGLCKNHYGMLKTYGFHPKDYYKKLKEQNNSCAICCEPETSLFHGKQVKKLAVDHDHATGKIRGLLCWRCNSVLGRLKEDVELFNKMIAYLTKHKQEIG